MSHAPTNPVDVPPYQLQPLVERTIGDRKLFFIQIRCAQAFGSEIYIGCTNGELLRYALQANPHAVHSYTLLSRQNVTHERPVQEIVLLPGLSAALVLADHQVSIYKLPFLELMPLTVIKPIRNVVTIAVDEQHLRRPVRSDPSQPADAVEFCVIKRNTIALYSLRERLFFQKEIPLPNGGLLARRSGRSLCVADNQNTYNLIDLDSATMFPVLPINQAESDVALRPFITVISENEFLILSWTGASTLGVFITGDGDPVRGTLDWPSYPESVCLDYPYITTLLPNETIEIHNIETQGIVQVVSAPGTTTQAEVADRKRLVVCAGGFAVPSSQRSDKLRRTAVALVRQRAGDTPELETEVDVDVDREEI
ncbi:hypothetical protein IEO21_03277 [Rhodonia placenta]|uniref:CNH domain-containing protein n=1 Tax=Rhodonia placenta TaxID=104341 RepID=A0A8H7P6J6_9APHY|nr:hypothetical protein IEO21_03277 [Postia placenta]